MLPQELARGLVERAKLAVEQRGADEHEPARRHHGAAVVLRAGIPQALRDELRILAKRNLPGEFAAVEIDGRERAPGWPDRRVALVVRELRVAVDPVAQEERRIRAQCRVDRRVAPFPQVSRQCVPALPVEVRCESRHAPASRRQQLGEFDVRHAFAEIDEPGKVAVAALVFAMAGRAQGVIDRGRIGAGRQRLLFREFQEPRHLVCIDVQQAGLRVECGTTPLAAAVESRE